MATLITDKLECPELDDRSYRVIQLPNRLEALLVHDPETDKASASVNVNVGSFSDPKELAGLAHYLEHMLFMGTEKYPVENEYSKYLAAHSGHSNAYTATTETNYFFEVAASWDGESPLYGALERFAQFFISPLFLSETLDREVRAVDSENKKNLQSDEWRLLQLSKSLSNPEHPYHKFSTGNLHTLRDEPLQRGVDVRKEIMHFHDKHYSANKMKLVVLGKESLEELESWVVELFSEVRNTNLPRYRWDDVPAYTEKQLLTQVVAKPVMEARQLDLYFPYQDEESMYRSSPNRYLSHLIGHEGPGSILAFIKAKGWANSLTAGAMSVCPGTSFFTISIRLTPEGLGLHQKVIQTVFEYIALLKETPPQRWIVDEIKGMAEVDFRYRQKAPASSFTSSTSSIMQKALPREYLLSGERIREFDAVAITKALSYLRSDNFRLTIVSQDVPGQWDQREQWYGTEYRVERIPAAFEAAIHAAIHSTADQRPTELRLPHANEFIPTRLTVERKEVKEPLRVPKLIRNEPGVRTWYKKDDRFWVPKGNVIITLRTPLAYITPQNVVKSRLYCDLVNDALVEYAYDAEISGLEYTLNTTKVGLDIELSGYNDKMPVLLEKVLHSMQNLVIQPDRFHIVKEKLTRKYRNWDFNSPYRQVGERLRWLMAERGWINEQYRAQLTDVTADDVGQHYRQLLHQCHIEVLAHGNFYKEEALRMTALVETILRPRALPSSQWHMPRNLILPQGSAHSFQRDLADPANVNNCIEYYLHLGPQSDVRLRAQALLLGQLTEEPGFDTLRTKEQLGYIVFTGAKSTGTTVGYRVVIQSERSPAYLELRIDAFLADFAKTLRGTPLAAFAALKSSLIAKILEKPKNLGQETTRFWAHIASEYLDFEQAQTDVDHLADISLEDMQAFYARFIEPSSPHRARLAIHLVAKSSPSATFDQKQAAEVLLGQVTQLLEASSIPIDSDALTTRLADLDLQSPDPTSFAAAAMDYMILDAGVSEAHAQKVTAMGVMALEEARHEVDGKDVSKEGEEIPSATKKAVWIEDVHEWKASLQASEAPKPVVALVAFEEGISKL